MSEGVASYLAFALSNTNLGMYR